jgi:hypothetical protein
MKTETASAASDGPNHQSLLVRKRVPGGVEVDTAHGEVTEDERDDESREHRGHPP